MRYSVLLDGSEIGNSDLEHCDRSMGIAFGLFVPTGDYQKVQPVFQLFADGNHQDYYQKRDLLNLELRLNGTRFVPTNCIHIVDHSLELGPDCMQLEVHLSNPNVVVELFPE